LLLAEPQPETRGFLERHLTNDGFQVVGDGTRPDLVLLGDTAALDACRERHGDVPVIVLGEPESDAVDRVRALDRGCDDFLAKPFDYEELLARIRAVLRRVQPSDAELLRHGPLAVDLRTRKVTVDGREVALTPKEFDILECLAADPGRVITRQEVLERAWDAHWYGPTKVLDVHIAALRRKLGVPGLVETVYGRGFRLGVPDQGQDPKSGAR
jgi:DNA-binding response OmpR family regulator